MQGIVRRRKLFISFFVSVMLVFSVAVSCTAADYTAIKIYPENVGVFTAVNKQQFVAYGIKSDGEYVNITKDVGWESSDENLVTIDEIGMASVVPGKTAGLVKITCSYPKTAFSNAGINMLILSSPGN